VDLRELDLAELRRRIAVVSQDIVLFRGSLADNVRYSAPHASRAQIVAAVRAAQLDELVATLPEASTVSSASAASSFRVARSSASRLPARCCKTRRYSCSTRRPRPWTRPPSAR